jgi:hypothetical protein
MTTVDRLIQLIKIDVMLAPDNDSGVELS